MEMPAAYDLSSRAKGDTLDFGVYTYLHFFFEEEGMALHLRSTVNGSEFYVNMPGDLREEIQAYGISEVILDASRASERIATILLQAGDPNQPLNIPFTYSLNERGDLEELLGMAESGKLSLVLLEGTRNSIYYHGAVGGTLGQEMRDILQEVASKLLAG